MSYKAVIFDLDGTLLDTIQDIADAANKTLAMMNFPQHSTDKYKIFVGDGVEELLKRALPEGNRDKETLSKALKLQLENYSQSWNNKTCPYAEINELLVELHKRHIKMGILSNKADDLTKLCVTQMLPVHLFTIVQGALSGIPRKPNPAPAVEMSGRLGVLPAEIMYLGDTNTDMQTAVGAGMYPVGVLWGFRGEQELKDNGAKALLENPMDLLGLLS